MLARAAARVAMRTVLRVAQVHTGAWREGGESLCYVDKTVDLGRELALKLGGHIEAQDLRVRVVDTDCTRGCPNSVDERPVVFICPSMSSPPLPFDIPAVDDESGEAGDSGESTHVRGWWSHIVGAGDAYPIDLCRYRVICASPLGSPHGSTSPVTTGLGPRFPVITPHDQAAVLAAVLDHLGVDKVHAILGGSMGGMQSLAFAAMYPDRVSRCCAIAATGHTSPATVALRAVQRSVIRLDPAFKGGRYAADAPPREGMYNARMIGMIGYRSRTEFDGRFDWVPEFTASQDPRGVLHPDNVSFDVENYLHHHAARFTEPHADYDANCYLTLSMCLDLMRLDDEDVLRAAAGGTTEFLLLPYSTDSLMPPNELAHLADRLGSAGAPVYFETLVSKYGHDAFMVNAPTERSALSWRLKAFLASDEGVVGVRDQVRQLE